MFRAAIQDAAYGPHPRQRADIYRKGRRTSQPIVLFIHGGAWRAGSKELYRFVGPSLARMGYVAVLINYRLRPEVDFPAYVEDAMLAARWVKEQAAQWGGDPEQVYIMGHSAGAHIGACMLLDRKYLGTPPWIRGFIGLAGAYSVHPGGREQADASKLTRPTGVPFLVLHGRRDMTVDYKVSTQFADRLTSVGTHTELELFNLGHIGIITTFLPVWPRFSQVTRRVKGFIG